MSPPQSHCIPHTDVYSRFHRQRLVAAVAALNRSDITAGITSWVHCSTKMCKEQEEKYGTANRTDPSQYR